MNELTQNDKENAPKKDLIIEMKFQIYMLCQKVIIY